MKKLITLVAILSVPSLFAHTKFEMQLLLKQDGCQREANPVIYLEDNAQGAIKIDDLDITIQQLAITEESTHVRITISDQDKVIAQPELIALWNQQATITFDEENGNSLSLSVKPSKGTHMLSQPLITKIQHSAANIEVGGIYHHYRNPNQLYRVIAIGLQEANEESCVVYESLYGDHIVWVRNVSVWLDTVEHQGQSVPRFQKAATTL
jgi:hypothetical protein